MTTLLDRLDTRQDRDWYAGEAAGQGWSGRCWSTRSAPGCGAGSELRRRTSPTSSPPADSDLAQQLVRDPYVFDQLSLTAPVAERDLEQALMDRL